MPLQTTPSPLTPQQNFEGRGRRPPFPPVVGGGCAAVPSGGDRSPSRCPARSGHWAHGGREAGLTRGESGLGRCGLWSGLGGLRGRGLRLQPRGGLGGGPRFGPLCQPLERPGAYNGSLCREKTQSAAGLPGLLPLPPAPRASCMRAR